MIPRLRERGAARQRGFALPIVLVFMVVASLTAFLAARLSRSDIKGVNNLQNEKEALTIAEAGIHEALYRLNLAPGSRVTVPGVNGGADFIASIAPAKPTPVTATSGWGWNGWVLFTTAAPSSAGAIFTTPSLQPISSRLPYSTTAASAESLQIVWDTCTSAAPSAGCALSGDVRRLPVSDPRPVVKITSTGQSGAARRKVTLWAVDIGGTGGGETMAGLIALGQSCSDGIHLTGNTSISAPNSAIQVNAGATTNPPSACTSLSTGGTASVTAEGINLVGSGSGSLNPTAQTGVLPMTDPLSTLQLPCFPGYSGGARGCQTITPTPTVQNATSNATLGAGCTGTAASPRTCSPANNAVLQPGIYYGGLDISGTVTLGSGVYIMAGGGLTMGNGGSNITTAAGGVTILNTLDPTSPTGQGNYTNFTLGNGNATVTIRSMTSGPYQGIVFAQDPDPANTSNLDFNGGTGSNYTFDGVIYAPNSVGDMQGNTTWNIAGNLVVRTLSLGGGSDLSITIPTTPCVGPSCAPGGVAYTPIAWQDF